MYDKSINFVVRKIDTLNSLLGGRFESTSAERQGVGVNIIWSEYNGQGHWFISELRSRIGM